LETEQVKLGTPRSVFITGAGTGMGKAFAHRFARAGYQVAVFEKDAAAAKLAVDELQAAGGDALAITGDVTCEQSIMDGFTSAIETYDKIDVLINNAGISCNVATEALTLERWNRALAVNQTGVFLASREFARRHPDGSEGVILNVSSMYGQIAAPERLAYCATKSAVSMMTKALAIEWASRGIRVNAVAPGYIDTPFFRALADEGRLSIAKIESRTPQGRLGTAEEIAELMLFIASDQNQFMTGQVVTSDGGWSAYGYYEQNTGVEG